MLNKSTSLREEHLLVANEARKYLIDFSIATDKKYQPNHHHEEIARELEKLAEWGDKQYKILILCEPPRHGKSQQATIDFPAWFLGKYPGKEIITASYSGELALDFGTKTREKVESEAYRFIFKTRLREDERSKGKWRTQEGGSYTSVGVGGATTGRGANCFPAGTLIRTEKGVLPIESCKYGTRVLSYNHENNRLEWKRVVGTLKQRKKGFITITTSSGNKVTSTRNHRFFVFGKGYITAESIEESVGKEKVELGYIPRRTTCRFFVCLLWKRIGTIVGSLYQAVTKRIQRHILFSAMFRETSCCEKQQEMLLRKLCFAWKNVLFPQMYPKPSSLKGYLLRILRSLVSSFKSFNQILFNDLQEQFSFEGNVPKQSQLQAWNGIRNLSQRVSTEEISYRERPESKVHNLSYQGEVSATSQRLQSKEQQERESGIGMQELSYYPSQIQEDAISAITSFDEELDVYDIQIEDNHNFFANGFLVHNCLLIDDPIKNREEAESEVYREKVCSWFTSTAFTRLEPNGVIVLILTRWHTDDLAGRILANKELSGRVKVMSFPAVKDDTALWPERFSLEALEEIKHTLGPYDWSALYQQQPITSANQEFKKEWFRPIEEEKVALMNTRNFLTIDTAISKQSSADYTGFCDNAINQENYWHLKAWRMKVDAAELVRLLFTLYEKRHYEKIGIEKTAYLDGLKPFLEEEQRKRDVFLPIVELKHNQIAKEIRIRGLIPRYSSGSIFHISAKDLENELLVFPLGANDYVADATAYQLQIAESSFPKPFTQLPTQPISKYQGTVQNREMSVILDKDIFGSEKPKRRFNQGEPEKVSRYQG